MRYQTQSVTNWVLFAFTLVSFSAVFYYSLQAADNETERLMATSAQSVTEDGYVINHHGTSADSGNTTGQVTHKNMNRAIFQTNYGDIEVEFNKNTPKTVENFIKLASSGFYDGTRFHRVIKDFMIQGGDPNSKDLSKINLWGQGGPGYQFDDEFTSQDAMLEGDLAMANAGPGTNGSQFFIVTKVGGTPWLIGHHTIFGHVVKGLDIALKIQDVPTDYPGQLDRPKEDVLLKKVIIE